MAADFADAAQRERQLDEIVAVYLEAAEAGRAPDRHDLLARHPELADELRAFFEDQDQFHSMVAPLRAVAEASPCPGRSDPSAPTIPHPAPGADSTDFAQSFGDYELLEELARGGMGLVYRARQLSLNRVVALKMILAGHLASAEEVQRFRLEAEAAANLDHPNIVPIYEVGEHGGRQYYSMKLIEGGSLAAGIRDQGSAVTKDRQRWAARLMATVARAVDHAHLHGILHRDLKPANILLDAGGEPHVSDFGLAKRMPGNAALGVAEPATPVNGAGPTPPRSALTQSGTAVGTPSYMAPEQATGERKALTTAADVYSLGAILYELLTGRPPFKGETPLNTLLEVVHREPARPRVLNPRVPRDLETICLKCLHKDPAKRYAGAAALADDLQRYLEGKPIQARPVGAAERVWRWCGRNWPVAAAGGLAAACLVGGAIGLTGFLFYLAWSQDQIRQRQADIVDKQKQLDEAVADAQTKKQEAEQKAAEAVRERERAEENFHEAFQAVQECMRVSDDLGNVPGVQPVQRKLLTAALKYFQGFVRQHRDDPRLRHEMAQAYFRAGRITSTLGSKTEAGDYYRHALALYQDLGRDRPDDVALQSQIVNALNNVGIIEGDLGHPPAAREAVQRALHLCEQLVRDHPDSHELPQLLDDLANVNHHLANRLREMGDFDQAFERFALSRGVMEQLVCTHPGNLDYQGELALVIENTGVLHAKLNHHADALRAFTEAAAIRERILDRRTRDSGAQIALAASYRDLAITHRSLGHSEESLALFEKVKDMREKAAGENPGVTLYQSDLAASLNDLGGVYYDNRQLPAAIQCYNRAIKIQEKLADLDPNVKYTRADLANTHFRAGLVLAANRQREDALRAFRRAREVQEKLVHDDPDNYEYRSALGGTLHNIGLNLDELKRYDEALAPLHEAIEQQKAALERAPQIDTYRRWLSRHFALLAEVLRNLSRADDAAGALLQRRALWAGNGPELVQVACDLASTAAAVGKGKAELSPEEKAQRRRCEDAAVETLRQAVAAGYRDAGAVQKDPRLAALRGRDDFKTLLAELQK